MKVIQMKKATKHLTMNPKIKEYTLFIVMTRAMIQVLAEPWQYKDALWGAGAILYEGRTIADLVGWGE